MRRSTPISRGRHQTSEVKSRDFAGHYRNADVAERFVFDAKGLTAAEALAAEVIGRVVKEPVEQGSY